MQVWFKNRRAKSRQQQKSCRQPAPSASHRETSQSAPRSSVTVTAHVTSSVTTSATSTPCTSQSGVTSVKSTSVSPPIVRDFRVKSSTKLSVAGGNMKTRCSEAASVASSLLTVPTSSVNQTSHCLSQASCKQAYSAAVSPVHLLSHISLPLSSTFPVTSRHSVTMQHANCATAINHSHQVDSCTRMQQSCRYTQTTGGSGQWQHHSPYTNHHLTPVAMATQCRLCPDNTYNAIASQPSCVSYMSPPVLHTPSSHGAYEWCHTKCFGDEPLSVNAVCNYYDCDDDTYQPTAAFSNH